MLRLLINMFYVVLWLVILGIALIAGALLFVVCAVFPIMILPVIGVIIFMVISYRRNLGVKGIQRVFPKFMGTPAKARIIPFLR